MGVNVIDQIVPKNAGDFGVCQDQYLIGGWRTVADIAARNAIPSQRRTVGMRTRVVATAQTFELVGGIDNANWTEVTGGGGPSVIADHTEEPLTFQIDQTGGTDLAATVTTQAAIDSHGAWKTIEGVIDSLPDNLLDLVRMELADGVHPMTSPRAFGNLQRINLCMRESIYPWLTGHIEIASKNSPVRISGTGEYDVATGVFPSPYNYVEITLTADPGFSADQYAFRFLRVVSGTAAGTLFPIRKHAGALFECLNFDQPLPDATSKVEIIESSAKIDFSTTPIDYVIPLAAPRELAAFYRGVQFTEVDIDFANRSFIPMRGITEFTRCRVVNGDPLWPYNNAQIRTDTTIIDCNSNNYGIGILVGQGAAILRNTLIGNLGSAGWYGGHAIYVRQYNYSAKYYRASGVLSQTAVENVVGDGINIEGFNADFAGGVGYKNGNVTGWAVHCRKGGRFYLQYSGGYAVGGAGTIKIDADEFSAVDWSDFRSVDPVTGNRLSMATEV